MEEKKKDSPESRFSRSIKVIVIFIFASFLFFCVVYSRPRNKQNHLIICKYILHQLIDYYPFGELWCDGIIQENSQMSGKWFLCSKDKIGPCSYAMNKNIPVDVNELPPDLVVLFESAPGWNRVGGVADVVMDRHGRPGANIAFADGRVEFVEAAEIAKLRWTVEDEQKRGTGVTRWRGCDSVGTWWPIPALPLRAFVWVAGVCWGGSPGQKRGAGATRWGYLVCSGTESPIPALRLGLLLLIIAHCIMYNGGMEYIKGAKIGRTGNCQN